MARPSLSCACWEWKRDDGGFSPYPPDQSFLIETAFTSNKTNSVLPRHTVHFKEMIQTNNSTGFRREVCRKTFNLSSNENTTAYWSWNEHGNIFVPYDTDISIFIEASFQRGEKLLNLSSHSPHLPYRVDLNAMKQIRQDYNTRRTIRRESLKPGMCLELMLATPPSTLTSTGSSSHSALVAGPYVPSIVPQSMYTNALFHPSPFTANMMDINNTSGPSSAFHCPSGVTFPVPAPTANLTTIPLTGTKMSSKAKSQGIAASSRGSPMATTRSKRPTKSCGATSTQGSASLQSTGMAPASRGRVLRNRRGSGRGAKTCGALPVAVPVSKRDGLSAFASKVNRLKPKDDEACPICMNQLTEVSGFESDEEHVPGALPPSLNVYKLRKCGHMLHYPCLTMYIKNSGTQSGFQCPTCKKSYGIKTGDMPPGKMNVRTVPFSLAGHKDCQTIEIVYSFSPGVHNGRSYRANSFPRTCYLPNSSEGQKVLKLLHVAWDRKLTFTIGTSVTTGAVDTVVWNEIHHKTELSNYNGHGYPDPNYLDNVLMELAAQGVSEDSDGESDTMLVVSSDSDSDL